MGLLNVLDRDMPNRWGQRRAGLSQDAFLKDIVNSETDGDATTAEVPAEAAAVAPEAPPEEQPDTPSRRASRRGGVISSTFHSNESAGDRRGSQTSNTSHSSQGGVESANAANAAPQEPLPRTPSTPKLPRRKGTMALWYSGDLWKLNSGNGGDSTDLMNWRRRFFTLAWDESLGLVLNYASEKEDCKQTLGCIIKGKGMAQASIATLEPVAVTLEESDIQNYENSIRTYDIAVHKRSLHDPCDMSVPSELKQIMITGVDQDGSSKSLILGWSTSEVLAAWLQVIETAVQHHYKSDLAIEHLQVNFAGGVSMFASGEPGTP